MDLKNTWAIVTGGSKGIGWAVVKDLLAEGVHVANFSRSEPPEQHERLFHYRCDLGQEESVQEAFHQLTVDHTPEVSILVNNAGIGYYKPFEETSASEWEQMFQVNVHGVFYLSKLVIPQMKAMEKGHIINIASIAATLGVPNMVGYASTKHAVRGLSHSLFMELRSFGIKVTAIYPGSVETQFFDNTPDMNLAANMLKPEDISASVLHALRSSDNCHHVDIEIRPLKPRG